jgi:hypothetical protein
VPFLELWPFVLVELSFLHVAFDAAFAYQSWHGAFSAIELNKLPSSDITV